tara:strand:- start:52983 stop:54281 length:1299 start_codon:yes stop_codon:yes gene_type:complete
MKSHQLFLAICASLILSISSCNNQTLRIFKASSARTKYLNTLQSSGISSTKIGMEWQSSATEVLSNAPQLEVPVALQGSFKSKSIEAKAWRIQLEKGASINIMVHWQARDSSKLIVDFLAEPDWKELNSFATQNDSVKLEADDTGFYLLRIQPELLGEGNFQVRINGTPTYETFPVQGKNSSAIQSVWGDVRDGGKRSHEGVDIFAPRGTPVIAPVPGVVTAVRDRGLGGKQVWLRDPERDWNLYFAHLDSQLVSNLQRVLPGDTLGLVGNTGNARTTAPHLHFGIYQSGAINPSPAIENVFKTADILPERQLPTFMSVNTSQANLRSAPTTSSEMVEQLKDDTPVIILSATSDWYQVQTFDGLNGFLYRTLLSTIDSAVLENKSTYAFTSPSRFSADSLLVELGPFYQIGLIDGFSVIKDQDENILYLPLQ